MEKILEVALKLIGIFKYTHCAKRTFNDLKLDNIMVDIPEGVDADPRVYLIDFGMSEKFEVGKKHISEEERVKVFKGNINFAS